MGSQGNEQRLRATTPVTGVPVNGAHLRAFSYIVLAENSLLDVVVSPKPVTQYGDHPVRQRTG